MMNFVNERKEHIIITQNGESRDTLIDDFGLYKIIKYAEADIENGKTKPATEVFSNLRRKYNLGK